MNYGINSVANTLSNLRQCDFCAHTFRETTVDLEEKRNVENADEIAARRYLYSDSRLLFSAHSYVKIRLGKLAGDL